MPTQDLQLDRDALARLLPAVVRRRFVWKFAVAVLLAMFVAGGIGGYLYVNATQTLDQRVESRVVSTAELQANGLDSWANGFRRQTRTLSSVREFQNGQPNVVEDYLLLESGDLTSAFVAVHYVQASDGTVEASTASGVSGRQLSELGVPWGQDMAGIDNETDTPSTVLVPETPYRSPVTNDTVLAFISSAPQNTEHLIVVEANLSARAKEFHQAMSGGETTVLGPDGGAVLGDPLDNSGTAIGANASGFAQTDEAVVGYAALGTLDWTVATQVPASSAYGLRNQIGSSILLTLLSALFVLGGVSLVVGHRSATALGRLGDKASAMERGELDVTLDSRRTDEIGQLFDAFDEMRESLRDQISTAEAAKERAEAARSQAESARTEATDARNEAIELTEQLEARAAEYGEVMAACADGDLTQRMATDAETEAMCQIATAYNDVMDEWEATLREVDTFSETVQTASDDVFENVTAVRERSDEVQGASVEMADGAERQSEELQTVWEEMESLSSTVEEMSAAADSVRRRADGMLEQSRAGRDAASGAADALDDIEASTDQAVAAVEELETLMDDVESVTDLISDIADQTNMLALNANIEAARADTDGDGFAVVADEVKTLADQTVDATEDIDDSIRRMRAQIDNSVAEMHATQTRVETGTETVEDALDAFDGIVDEVEAATSGMREIDRTTDEQADSTQEVVSMVETVADISERTASEADRVAVATSEQVETVEAVETDLGRLSERASDLGEVLATFDIDDEGDSPEIESSGPTSVITRVGDGTGADDSTSDDAGPMVLDPDMASSAADSTTSDTGDAADGDEETPGPSPMIGDGGKQD